MSPQSASPSGRRPPPPAAFFAGPPSAAGAGGGAARTPARSPAGAVSPSPASAPPALPGLRHPALLGGKAHQHPAGGFPFAGPRDSGFRLPPDESTPAAQANARPQARSAGPAARAAAANAPPPAGFPMNIAFGVPSGTPAEMAEAMLSTHFSEMFAASQRSDASRSPPGDRRHRRHHSFLPRRRLAISSPTLVASSTARKDTIPIVRPADDAGEVVRRGRRNSLPQSELGLVKRLLRQAISMSPKLKAFGGPASAPEDDSGSSTSGSRCSSAGRGPDILYPREETRPSSRQRTGEAGAAPRRTSPPSHPEVPDGPPGFPHEIPVAGPASSTPKSLPTAGPSPPDTASSKESPAAGFVSLTEADHKWITPERDKEAVEADDADVDRLSRMMRAAACREKTFIREITSAPAPAQHPGAFRGPQPEAAAPLPVGLGLSFAKGCHMPSKSGSEETFRAGACLASPGEKARGGTPGVGSPFEPASVGSRSFSPPYPGATSPPPTPDSAGEAEVVAALFGRAPPPAEGAESAARPSPPGPVSEPSANAPPPPASAGRPTHHEDNGADDGDRTKETWQASTVESAGGHGAGLATMIRRIDSLHVDKRWRWTPPAAKRQGRAAETNDGGGAEPADRVRPVVHTVRRAKPVVSRLPAALRGDFGAPDLASSRDGAAEFGIRHYMFSPVTPKSPPPPPLAAPPVAVGRSPGQARLHFDDDDDDGDDDDSLPLQGRSFAPADRQSPDGGAEPAARTSPGSGRSHPSPRPLPASAIKARQLHDLTGLMDAMVRDLEVAASSSPSPSPSGQ